MTRLAKKVVLTLALIAAPLAASAQAQEIALTLSKHFKNGSISLALGSGPRCVLEPRREPARVWIAGHYESRCERVWVAGCSRKEWVPPCYEWRVTACGQRYQVLARAGYWHTVSEPGRFETRNVQVWVPGHWQAHGY